MEPTPQLSPRKFTMVALSILILSLGLLMFEISLTRVFSVMLAYHYVFIAVSAALLGLGLGSVLLRFTKTKIPARHGIGTLCVLSLAFALSVQIATALVLRIPYTEFFAVYYVITFVPFFFSGMVFALAFDMFTEHSNKLYCASLVGSGLGPIATIFALESLGGVNAILLVGAVSAIGAIMLAISTRSKKLISSSLIVFTLLFAIFGTNLSGNYIGEIRSESQQKELYAILNDPQYGGRITRTYWSAYARTDLVELENDPDIKYIFTDGGAGTQMFRFDGDNFDDINYLMGTSAAFPFYFGDVDNVLIIGPGGGKDVLVALMGGAKRITAVEVNPDIVRIVDEESEFNGGISHRENVSWVVDEGRSFVKRSSEKYDVIMLMLVLTKSARDVVGYSLAESYIFTVEAFEDYMDHLTENGRLVIVGHGEEEAVKLFATGIAALEKKGENVYDASRHMIMVREPTHHSLPALILRKSPFSENESAYIHGIGNSLGFQPMFYPYTHESQMIAPLVSGETTFEEWVSAMPFDASPSTDDSPFFYNYIEKGLPSSLSSLFYGLVILNVFLAIVALQSMKRGHAETRDTKSAHRRTNSFSLVFYFLLLGLGFMLIEVALLQKFILFIGQPTLTFSLVLFCLLLGGGIGSYISGRFTGDSTKKVILVSLLIGVVVAIYAFVLPYVFFQSLGQDLAVRSAISAALLLPLGLLMGIPFPMGLKIFRQSFDNEVGWMWGINGAASVLGSVIAVVVATMYGFTSALAVGVVCYLLVSFVVHPDKKQLLRKLA